MPRRDNTLTDYTPQLRLCELAPPARARGAAIRIFSEGQELELATRLLELRDEAELDHFLGDVIKAVGGTLGKLVKGPTARALGGVLKRVARTALPIAGGVVGGAFGGPLGAMLGRGLASVAGQALGLELEGLSAEDREFEVARQFVRFAGETVENALRAPERANAASVAHEAARAAGLARAPGLIGASAPRSSVGRWVRRGNAIVLFGV